MSEELKSKTPPESVLRMAAEIVSAYVSHNALPSAQIPELIQTVFKSLSEMETPEAEQVEEAPKPAVPVRKSVTPDYIICLEDGKKLKMLKRHLRTTYNMTPEEYRAKWGLAPDYPMVAPSHAAQRSAFAKQIGLGRKREGESTRRGGRRAKA
ncbi:MAG: transcriptional regulator [Rhodospirillaceae bacterium]|nr:transcriptional regulator [Rhodospirillaceae bacterium]